MLVFIGEILKPVKNCWGFWGRRNQNKKKKANIHHFVTRKHFAADNSKIKVIVFSFPLSVCFQGSSVESLFSLTSDKTDLVSLCASQRVLRPDCRGKTVIIWSLR
ncbi:hypothetical protein AMECASPLE_016107 [Ameca splendens]|uniref:Uncharacterized protein n=1 Tax=Ameca splendens TaxID=208324 RepID=A0ABV0XF88_9TELE